MSFEAVIGDVICRAGRGCKCIHKQNTSFMGGQVKGMKCGLLSGKGHDKASRDTFCSWAGGEIS